MALQSSGAISLSQIQTEFGGANPISMSEYYRDGSYVPSTISTLVYDPGPSASDFTYNTASGAQTYWRLYGQGSYWLGGIIYWGGATMSSSVSTTATSYSVGAYTYYKGTVFSSVTYTYEHSRIRRTSGSSTTVNSGIPTSGAISMNQFYGGRKT